MRKIYSYIGIGIALFYSGISFAQGVNCATAVPITAGTHNANGPSSGAGASNACFGSGAVNADWYSFTAPCDGLMTVSSEIAVGSPDTRLSIYTGSCGALACFALDDDGGVGFTSLISNVAVTGGTTYYIEWDDRWGATAAFQWQLFYTPSGVSGVVSTPTNTSAAINWNPAGAETDWTIEYGLAGFIPGSGTAVNVLTSDYVITGLNPETTYEYYIMAGAGPCNLGPFSFNTLPLCPMPTGTFVNGLTTDAATLNWVAGGVEDTWDVEWGNNGFLLGAGNQDFGLAVTNDPLTGLSVDTDYHWYVRAVCDLNMGDGVDTTSFFVGPLSFSTNAVCANPSALGVMNNTGFESDLTWTAGGTETEWNVQWGDAGFVLGGVDANILTNVTTLPINLTGLTPNTPYQFYVQSVCGSTSDSLSSWVGPFNWNTIPFCANPSGLGSTAYTTTGATIDWTAGGSETEWTYEFGEVGFVLGTGTQTTVTGATQILTGLTPGTNYCFYVQANCGSTSDSSSAWVGPHCFSTLVACAQPTNLGAMNITNTAANIFWQAGGSETSWDVEWGMPGFAVDNGEEAGSATTGTNPHYLTGLNESAPYWFYVRAACGGVDGNSAWSGPFAFNTLLVNNQPCDAIEITVDAPMIQHYNNGATSQVGEPSPPIVGSCIAQDGWCASGNNNTVWFMFDAPSTGAATITTFNEDMTSNYTNIALYSVNDCGAFASYDLQGANTLDPLATGPPYGSTLTVCALTSGETYYVKVDAISGFAPGNFGIEVTSVDPAISAGTASPIDICQDSPVLDLFTAITGNTTTNGTWYNPIAAPGNELPSSVSLVGVATGTYQFFYVDGSVCGSDTVETSVTIEANPSAGMDNAITGCNTGDIHLIQALAGIPQMGGTWTDDDATGALSNGIFQSEMFAAGVYEFTYTVDNGGSCPPATATVIITLDDCVGLGITNENSDILSVYPNPVVDVLTIQNLTIAVGTIEVLDIQGKLMSAEQVTNIQGNYELNMNEMESGVYVVRITTENTVQEVRVVKQ